jgi:hypothetical protein
MAAPYSWLTFLAGRQQLAARLADPDMVRWTDAELKLYIAEALRVWNCLTFTWKTEFTYSIGAGSAAVWISLGTLAGSPRFRTLTSNDVFTLMEYHLGEPPTGGTWTGTTQFNINDLAIALQRYRDEMIQLSNCNMANITLPYDVNVRRIDLPDNVLEVPRSRWIPVQPAAPEAARPPVTLFRDDKMAEMGYQPGYLQEQNGSPSFYNVATSPPLTLDVDVAPVVPGTYDLLVLESGIPIAPPTASLLNAGVQSWTRI